MRFLHLTWRYGRPALYLLWRTFFLLLLLANLGLALVYGGFLYLENYRGFVERRLSAALAQPLSVQRIHTYWDGWLPSLELVQVALRDPVGDRPVAGFARARVQIDLVASLLHADLRTEALSISGTRLSLAHQPDGQVKIGGLADSGEAGGHAAPGFLTWLLRQPRFDLEFASLEWQGQSGRPLRFQEASLHLEREAYRHAFRARLVFPDSPGEPPLLAGSGLRAQGGSLQVAGWSEWRDDHLLRLVGQANGQDLRLSSRTHVLEVPLVSGAFHLHRTPGSPWQLDIEHFALRSAQRAWPASRVSLKGSPADGYTRLEGRIDTLDLNEVLPLLWELNAVPPALREALAALRPQAALSDLAFHYSPRDWGLRCGFQAWRNQPWRHVPGLENWAGALELGPRGGRLALATQAAVYRAPDLYSAPLELDRVHGALTWDYDDARAGWVIAGRDIQFGNPDVAWASLGGEVFVPAGDGAPHGDLRVDFGDARLAGVARYVPDRLAGEAAMHWLRHGLRGGTIAQGEFVLRGPLPALPFDHGEGTLRLTGQVVEGGIDYAPGWPALDGVRAEVTLDRRQLRIEADAGRIAGNRIRRATLGIDDYTARNPLLTVEGDTDGHADNGLRFIRASPLQKSLDVGQNSLALGGKALVHLDLRIPLAHGAIATQGRVEFKNASVHAKHLGLTLENVNGGLRFTDTRIEADGLRGELFGAPARLALATLEDGATRARLDGEADPEFLRKLALHLDPDFAYLPLLARLRGSAPWEAVFDFLPGAGPATPGPIDLSVRSPLTGLKIDLPEPLRKSAAASRPFHLHTRLQTDAPRQLSVAYGDIANLRVETGPQGPRRAALRFGAEPARLPERGARVSGRIAALEVTPWRELLDGLAGPDGPSALLPEVDLEVQRLEFMGQTWHDLKIRAQAEADAWQARLDAQELEQGTLRYTPSGPRLEFTCQRLALAAPAAGAAPPAPAAALPARLPEVSVACAHLHYAGADLGGLRFKAQPTGAQWMFDTLEVRNDAFTLSALGRWHAADGGSATQLSGSLDSPAFGEALAHLGYGGGGSFQGGATRIGFDATWPGGPGDFDLARLRAHLRLDIAQGRLLDVEPGVGRIFGLFDLRAIPHRLSLDFSDVFGAGLGFNAIRGEFLLENGLARTDNLTLEGPSALVRLSGQTDLKRQTYDQVMRVVPHVSTTLPVAGALVGGLGVGAAVLLVQQVLQDEIDQALVHEYTIRGAWQAPLVEAVGADK